MRLAARKVRTFMAPASPARSVACAADGERTGRPDIGESAPFAAAAERRGKHHIRDPEGARLRARCTAPQIINMSFAGPKDLIERGISATQLAKGIVMVAAAGNAGAKSPPLYPAANRQCDCGRRHRCPGQIVCGIEPWRPYRRISSRRRYFPARAGRKISDGVRHLVFRRLYQRPCGADAGAQSCLEAGRGARNLDEDRPRSRQPPDATTCSAPAKPTPLRRFRR